MPLLFSRDRPISLKAITDCIARNRGILFSKGAEFRKIAAMTADNAARYCICSKSRTCAPIST